MTFLDFIRLCGYMLLKLLLNPDFVILIGVGVSFLAALFYYRLRKPYRRLLHFVVPTFVGFGLFAFAVFQNPEAGGWALVLVPTFCFCGFVGSALGGLVSWVARKKSCLQTDKMNTENRLPPET